MKITSFQPDILTPKQDEVIAILEALGFQKQHQSRDLPNNKSTYIVMKNEDDFKVDVTSLRVIPKDMTTIRMNIDNIEEAVKLLSGMGFTNTSGLIYESASSKRCIMTSPTGFAFSLVEHIKKK